MKKRLIWSFFKLAVNGIKAFFETISFVKHEWREDSWLAIYAPKPKVPVLSQDASYVG